MTKRYDEYKDSGIEWLGEIPKHWEVKKLKNVVFNLDYKRVPISSEDRVFGDYPYYGASGIVDYVENYIFAEDLLLVSEDGANLVDRTKPIAFIAKGKYWVNNHAHIMKGKKTNINLLAYFLDSRDLSDIVSGSTRGKLTKGDLQEIKILSFDKKEQDLIATYLDNKTYKIDSALAELTKQKDLLIELKKSTIHQAVTKGLDSTVEMKDSGIEWIGEISSDFNIKKLKNISNNFYSGGTPSSGNDLYYSSVEDIDSIRWVAIGDFETNGIYETKKRITEDGRLNKNLKILPSGSLLYSIYATLGKTAILKNNACINQAILNIESIDRLIKKEYLNYYLMYMENFIKLKAKLSTQYNLNSEIVKNYEIIIPSRLEQENIVNYLDKKTGQIDQSIEVIDNQITQMKEYKKTLINDVVTGKIKVI